MGETVVIVGLNASNDGRSCEFHRICGRETLVNDSVVRFRTCQVVRHGKVENAIAVYWVTDGVDRCMVGFLKREAVQNADKYDGKLAQVVSFLSKSDDLEEQEFSEMNAGACIAAMIELIRSSS
jgi:hypothetical protein